MLATDPAKGSASAEFSWQGNDEGDCVRGRGWVTVGTAGRLVAVSFYSMGTTLASSPNAADFFNSLLAGR
jgi:hypothetical protein